MDKIKVIIVEDDMITAKDIAQRLEIEGCETVAIANDGMNALEIIKKQKIDLALLDIGLGKNKMDGIELAKRIKNLSDMPTIFLTAYADENTIKRAMETMPSSYLVKPINSKQLMVSVNLAMSRFAMSKSDINYSSTSADKNAESDHFIFNDSIFIKCKERFCKTELSKILWIEADGNYATIVTPENKYTIITSIGTLLIQLDKYASYIVRVHRSFAVNINLMDSFDHISIFFKGTEIPIGKSYKDEFFRRIGYK